MHAIGRVANTYSKSRRAPDALVYAVTTIFAFRISSLIGTHDLQIAPALV
jgi:hypothetical protein